MILYFRAVFKPPCTMHWSLSTFYAMLISRRPSSLASDSIKSKPLHNISSGSENSLAEEIENDFLKNGSEPAKKGQVQLSTLNTCDLP